jgi:hypothetical protein
MGKGIRDFKRSLKDVEHSIDASDQLPPPPPPPAPVAKSPEPGEPRKLSE